MFLKVLHELLMNWLNQDLSPGFVNSETSQSAGALSSKVKKKYIYIFFDELEQDDFWNIIECAFF